MYCSFFLYDTAARPAMYSYSYCSPPSFIDRHGGTRRVAYRTAFLTSTVLLCTFTKLLRYRYRTAVYGTQAPLLLVRVLVRVRDCTVLYCTRTVLYFIQYSPCSYEYRYSFCSSKSYCKQCRYSTVRVVYSSRTVSYRSTVLE